MDCTAFISGVFNVSAYNKCSIAVTLNGKTEHIPLQYTTNSGTNFCFNGVLNLEKRDAMGALASLNKA